MRRDGDDFTSPSRRFLFLTTPGAGSGAALPRLLALIRRVPFLAGARIVVARSTDEMRAALQTLEPDEIPVAAGGDGTVNLMARAMRRESLGSRVGATLPLGTGNAFAYSLGAGTVPAAIAVLWAGDSRPVDLMEIDRPEAPVALVSISAGFEARLIGALSRLRARRLGPALRGLAAAIAPSSAGVALTLDGRPFAALREKHYNVGLYNLPCYAFGVRVHPEAAGDDGMAEAVSHDTAASYWRGIRRSWSGHVTTARGEPARSGRIASGGSDGPVRIARWGHAVLESDRPIQVDGEAVTGGRFHIRVERAALAWLAPPAHTRDDVAAAARPRA